MRVAVDQDTITSDDEDLLALIIASHAEVVDTDDE